MSGRNIIWSKDQAIVEIASISCELDSGITTQSLESIFSILDLLVRTLPDAAKPEPRTTVKNLYSQCGTPGVMPSAISLIWKFRDLCFGSLDQQSANASAAQITVSEDDYERTYTLEIRMPK